MPIRPEWTQYYSRAAGWPELSGRIIRRDGYRCKQCGIHNYALIMRVDDAGGYTLAPRGWQGRGGWIEIDPLLYEPATGKITRVVLTVAHLNRMPWDRREENLATLCGGCHLRHDTDQHAQQARHTRIDRKDESFVAPLYPGLRAWRAGRA
jgi:hypothetical protein